jgi:SAM-dependent methyltransferase
MNKGAPIRWMENTYLRKHLRGQGIEIGGLWKKFKVRPSAKVWYVDRLSADDLAKQYAEVLEKIVVPDIVADGEDLPLRDLDFIIASHVLEHLPSPLKALRSWYDALRSGGTLLLKVPDKRFTFDRNRERTPLQHLLEEFDDPTRIDTRAHYADWVEHVDGKPAGSAEFNAQLRSLMGTNYSIHYHVWTDQDLKDIIDHTRNAWRMAWRPVVFWNAHFYRKETVAVLQKA